MITQNSISGGKSSAYIAANYPADYNLFSLVTTNHKSVIYPDKKIRQFVSDKIGREFIGTLEEDTIIRTIIELEQFIGKEIIWVAGCTFEDSIKRELKSGETRYLLPCVQRRSCTYDMKILPMSQFWYDNIKEPVEVRIGFRANEGRRANNMIDRCNKNGFIEQKFVIGRHKNGNNKWQTMEYQKPVFPLIEDGIFKDNIDHFWKNKNVKFAEFNNCTGCFHRSPMLLKYMSQKHPAKFQWFIDMEKKGMQTFSNTMTFKQNIQYEQIKNHKTQLNLFSDDFTDCDSGYCGL